MTRKMHSTYVEMNFTGGDPDLLIQELNELKERAKLDDLKLDHIEVESGFLVARMTGPETAEQQKMRLRAERRNKNERRKLYKELKNEFGD